MHNSSNILRNVEMPYTVKFKSLKHHLSRVKVSIRRTLHWWICWYWYLCYWEHNPTNFMTLQLWTTDNFKETGRCCHSLHTIVRLPSVLTKVCAFGLERWKLVYSPPQYTHISKANLAFVHSFIGKFQKQLFHDHLNFLTLLCFKQL